MQFAYIDIVPLDGFSGKGSSLRSPTHLLSNAKSPKRLKFPSPNGHTTPVEPSTGSYYHCFLDVHAFIASPCTPGETAELYFSLFNRDENRFVTEEFCLVLNHLGSPARDPEQRLGRLRTLFVDLKHEDVADSIFLVCRMVRNGALKMRSENFSSPGAMLDTHVRKGSVRRPSANTGTLRSSSSIVDSITDDSFSMNSDFGRQTTMTIDTTVTTTASIVDGRPSFRRPLGCAVLELPHLSKLMTQGGDKTGTGLEFPMPIFSSRDENTFANLHESIIHGRTKDHVTSSR